MTELCFHSVQSPPPVPGVPTHTLPISHNPLAQSGLQSRSIPSSSEADAHSGIAPFLPSITQFTMAYSLTARKSSTYNLASRRFPGYETSRKWGIRIDAVRMYPDKKRRRAAARFLSVVPMLRRISPFPLSSWTPFTQQRGPSSFACFLRRLKGKGRCKKLH